MTTSQIIQIYAHDFRGIKMTQDELQSMLESFVEEISD